MMLAAVDGEIAKEELALYRGVAERIRTGEPSEFDSGWEDSVRSMAYVGFLTAVLPPEKIVREYVRKSERRWARFAACLPNDASDSFPRSSGWRLLTAYILRSNAPAFERLRRRWKNVTFRFGLRILSGSSG